MAMATKAKRRRVPKKSIRLACDNCFREDCDGITPKRLKFLRSKAGGWKRVSREQTYAQSCKTYDDQRDAPPGYSVFDWHTHLGRCPDCADEDD